MRSKRDSLDQAFKNFDHDRGVAQRRISRSRLVVTITATLGLGLAIGLGGVAAHFIAKFY